MSVQAGRIEHLTVLKLYMHGGGTPPPGRDSSARRALPRVAVELRLPGPAPTARLELDPKLLGLPRTLGEAREFRYGEPSFVLPVDRMAELRAALASRPDPSAPLWLELSAPVGTLPLVPWERLLSPALGVQILRLSYFSVPAVANPGPVDVALCASSPVAKVRIEPGLIRRLLEEALRNIPGGATFHVFTDSLLHDALKSFVEALDDVGREIVLHDPAAAPSAVQPRYVGEEDGPDAPEDVTEPVAESEPRNPWLRWMKQELGEQGVDAVHFVGHGYLSRQHGMLALAESPTVNRDAQIARFVGPRELSSFLTALGAGVVGFTAVPHNFSVLGLRLLADQMARLRVGTVLLHEPASDDDLGGLGDACADLFGSPAADRQRPSESRGVAVYCHPSQAGDVTVLEDVNRLLTRFTVAQVPRLKPDTSQVAVPRWRLATQRALESSVGNLLDARPSKRMEPVREGAERAFEFIRKAVQSEDR
jgi:hypothetical protein